MANQIITDSFETLGGAMQSGGKQVKQIVKKMGDDIAEGVGIQPSRDDSIPPEAKNPPAHNDAQYDKIEQAAKKRQIAKYKQLQDEILQLSKKRDQEMEKYHMPGFTDEQKKEKQVQQLQEGQSPEKKLPPLPVQRAQKKTEMNRGASG